MLRALDLRLLRLLRTRGHAPPVQAAAIALARAGENGLLWQAVGAVGAVADRERRPLYLRAMRTVLAVLVVNSAVKLVIGRARPVLDDLPPLTTVLSGRSYPSAHASTSFAAARVLSGALPAPPLYAAAAAMALTRPYLGVHYPSDVLAGAVLGDALTHLIP